MERSYWVPRLESPRVGNPKPTLQIYKNKTDLLNSFGVRTIGAICGNLLQSCDLAETHTQKMSGRRSEGSTESGSVGSSRGSTLKVVQWDHLEDPHGKSEGKKGMKIGSVNTRKNSLALERGRTKRTRQYRMLQGTSNWMREMRSLNDCVDW